MCRLENPLFGDHQFLRRSGNGRTGVILVTHLDTVYPEEEEKRHGFTWQVEDGRIYGPGVNDNKGGTVMIWLVLSPCGISRRKSSRASRGRLRPMPRKKNLCAISRSYAARGCHANAAQRWSLKRAVVQAEE